MFVRKQTRQLQIKANIQKKRRSSDCSQRAPLTNGHEARGPNHVQVKDSPGWPKEGKERFTNNREGGKKESLNRKAGKS